MAVEYQVKYTPGFDPTIVNVSQNDVGRQFDLKIIDETGAAQQIPSGSTVKFVGMKPSGLGFTVNCTFTNSVVHVTTTDIMTDEHGLIPAEVQITNGNTVIGTANVNLRVEKNPHPEGTIDDNLIRIIPTFEVIYQRLDILESSMQTAENNISKLRKRMGTVEDQADDAYALASQAADMAHAQGIEIGGIRRAYDGTVYQTAGDAVRAQAFRGTDTTLSVSGKAADAKVTGDEISALNSVSKDLSKKINTFVTEYNVNLFDPEKVTAEKYVIPSTGELGNNVSFSASDYIPVNGGTIYTISANNSYYGAWYDSTHTYITGGITQNISGEHTITYNAPENAVYFRISCQTLELSSLKFYIVSDYNEVLNTDIYVREENIIPTATTKKYITPSDNLVDVFLNNAGKTIYVTAGSYDIIQHYKDYFGSDYFDNYVSYNTTGKIVDAGLQIGRDTKVYFAPNAVLTCNYTGSNTAVRANFSAFALCGNVMIDGLTLECSGIRDAIHDDLDVNYNGFTVIRNCKIVSSTRCIGGGMHTASHYLIENNYFNGAASVGYDISYHNRVAASAYNRMIIKDNYFSAGVSIRYAGTSTDISEVLICNNSMSKAIEFRAENASETVINVELKDWNNVIRS